MRMMKKKNPPGIYYMLASVIFFTVVNTLVKFTGSSASGWTKAFYRSLFGLFALILWLVIKRKSFTIHRLPLLIARGITGGAALGLAFWTMELKGLSISVFYLNTYPIFAPLFAALLYKEKFNKWLFIPLAIVLTGISILTNPFQTALSLGDISGILSGVCAGLAVATVRELRKTNESEYIYLSFTLFAIPVSIFAVVLLPNQTFHITFSQELTPAIVWISLVCIGISATIAQLFMTEGYQSLSTQTGSLIEVLQLPVITVVAIVVFHEPFTWSTMIGGILIGCGVIVTILQKKEFLKKKL
jgi:drug/metabolite transporter (DMT)-like permease